MNESARTQFSNLTNAGKQVFLADLGFELTISGRDFVLSRKAQDAVAALSGLNELQHQILSQIRHLGRDSDRYPDDVLWAILDETAATYSIGDDLAKAIVSCASGSA